METEVKQVQLFHYFPEMNKLAVGGNILSSIKKIGLQELIKASTLKFMMW